MRLFTSSGCYFGEKKSGENLSAFFLHREAVRTKVDFQSFDAALIKSTELNAEAQAIFSKVWSAHAPQLVSADSLQKALSVGQLVDIEWKMGVATASSQCKILAHPFVSVVLKIATSDGRVVSHPFEMPT